MFVFGWILLGKIDVGRAAESLLITQAGTILILLHIRSLDAVQLHSIVEICFVFFFFPEVGLSSAVLCASTCGTTFFPHQKEAQIPF